MIAIPLISAGRSPWVQHQARLHSETLSYQPPKTKMFLRITCLCSSWVFSSIHENRSDSAPLYTLCEETSAHAEPAACLDPSLQALIPDRLPPKRSCLWHLPNLECTEPSVYLREVSTLWVQTTKLGLTAVMPPAKPVRSAGFTFMPETYHILLSQKKICILTGSTLPDPC